MTNDIELKRLNLDYVKLTNKSYAVGTRDLLHLTSPSIVDIDYLALYSKPSEYLMTDNTAVCFYEYDNVFDGKNGLWDAIYYDDKPRLKRYKERFNDVKYIISPDYSVFGDGFDAMNAFNIQRSRIVSLWLIHECGKAVIPNITYSNKESFEYFLDGLEQCKVVSFSVKESLVDKEQRELLSLAINITVNRLSMLNTIIVYSVSYDDSRIHELFRIAKQKGIDVIIPDNCLRRRNFGKKLEMI